MTLFLSSYKIVKSKIYILLMIVVSFTNLSNAQTNYSFKKGDFGVGFNVTGLINAINVQPQESQVINDYIFGGRYFFKDDMSVDFGIGINGVNNNLSIVDSVGTFQRNFDSLYAKNNIFLTFGVEKHFFATERLVPFVGANVGLGLMGKTKRQSVTTLQDTVGTRRIEVSDDFPGGFHLGINLRTGFNFFVAKNLAIGLNYQFGYRFLRSGGDFNRVVIDNPITGASTINRQIGSDLTRTRGFYFNSQANITIQYFFSFKS